MEQRTGDISGIDEFMCNLVKTQSLDKSKIIVMLQRVQHRYGFLSREAMSSIARNLKMPEVDVYGVATFYHLFTFDPRGVHNCIICKGTACHVKGADEIIDALSEEFEIATAINNMTTGKKSRFCNLAPL